MRAVILGSAAGGGVPQWNCRCPVCELAWRGDPRVKPRTQTSIAVSFEGERWMLLDAAPELRHQILANSVLQPSRAGRNSPITAVVLTSGDVDHLAGLLCLRERHAFALLGTRETLQQVASSPLFGVLDPGLVERVTLGLDEPFAVNGLAVTPFAVPGKVPLYREADDVAVGGETEAVIGLEVSDGRHRLCYVPGIAHLTPALVRRLGSADVLALDGTTYADDELPRLGVSAKTAGRMGHLAIAGEHGSIRAFAGSSARKILIHLNNTNPVLIEDSPERTAVVAAGWDVAFDGMEIAL